MKYLMRILLVSLSLLLMAEVAMAEGDTAAGKTKIATCAACHGLDGNSTDPTQYPSLAGLGENYLIKQLHDIKTGGEKGGRDVSDVMKPFAALIKEDDIEDIAAYYSSQTMKLTGAKELTVKLNSGDSVDSLVLGQAVYRYGNPNTGVPACSGCHSPTGQGNAPAGYPRLGGQSPDYVSKQLHAFRLGDRANDGEPRPMRQVAEHLSDAEIAALSNYIAGLH